MGNDCSQTLSHWFINHDDVCRICHPLFQKSQILYFALTLNNADTFRITSCMLRSSSGVPLHFLCNLFAAFADIRASSSAALDSYANAKGIAQWDFYISNVRTQFFNCIDRRLNMIVVKKIDVHVLKTSFLM